MEKVMLLLVPIRIVHFLILDLLSRIKPLEPLQPRMPDWPPITLTIYLYFVRL